ncbi:MULTISPECIES: hypothetical protein [Haloferax]|uniref:DUF8058 domain-containing protein n=1 Tax=Haloferax marinum TaxID=2666143 RepID=A0A6A8G9G6_9EURY|nr:MULTISPECIES: hypothetical protein [Haloferax]KAB1198436.1 hypothetical protein Hfx1150_13295 [Haloferax sp. CBA1150]MRW97537.1 hypothetical protein [Haloferax marinum]
MNWHRVVAVYALAAGAAILGLWTVLVMTEQVTELRTEPFSMFTHLVAEGFTAVTLLSAGLGLLRRKEWAQPLCLVGFGMLLYSVINSAGYYAQLGQVGAMAVFSALALTTVVALGWVLVDARQRRRRASW